MYSISPVNISTFFFFCYEQAKKKKKKKKKKYFIGIGRHFGYAKRQLQISLRIVFATLRRKLLPQKLLQLNRKFDFILRITVNVSVKWTQPKKRHNTRP